ncbi:hypothetical protein N7510_001120 [Penicillium lagena]|uniref:uncharacterized protein n=1 Tax=Penicillium lagena TaxID=94218 RepID=UPI00253FBD37|nr:uncharacterized protein N7510_001120 [Penicillium lagena]KAJ5624811.1 hypothetical protein N7510_001120 [Penicillium lagena]
MKTLETTRNKCVPTRSPPSERSIQQSKRHRGDGATILAWHAQGLQGEITRSQQDTVQQRMGRRMSSRSKLPEIGGFYTGRLSKSIAYVSVAYLVFGVILSMFPTMGPNPSPSDMNYTVVINGFVWSSCMAYYFLFVHRWYSGP